MTKSEIIKEVKDLESKLESLYFSKEKVSDTMYSIKEIRDKLDILREMRNVSFFREALEDNNNN